MELLSVLTWIFAGVLVVALAASLIAILWRLRRVATGLEEVHEALAAVDQQTGPLARRLQPLEEAVTRSSDEWQQSQSALASAEQHVAALTGGHGASTSES